MYADTVTPPQSLGMNLNDDTPPPSTPSLVGLKKFNLGAVAPRRLMFDDDDDAVTLPPPTPTLTPPPLPLKQHLAPRRLFHPTPQKKQPKVAAPQKLHPMPRVAVPPARTWTSGFQAIAVKWNQKAMDTYFSTSAVKYMR